MTNKTRKRVRKTLKSRMKRKSKRIIHKGGASYENGENRNGNNRNPKRFKSEILKNDSESEYEDIMPKNDSESEYEEVILRQIDNSHVIEDIMTPEKPGTPAEPSNFYKRDEGFYTYLSKNKIINFEELSDTDRANEYMNYLVLNPSVEHPIGIPNGKLHQLIIAYRYEFRPEESLNFLLDYADTNFLLKMLHDQPATYLPNGISKMWKYIGSKGDAGRNLFNKLLFLQYKNGILLSKGLCYFPPATEEITVYRGIRGTTPVPKTNEPVIYLMSTSLNEHAAMFFAERTGKRKLLSITIPKNFPFSYISGFERVEAEILLGYKSTFDVRPKIIKDGIERYNLTLTGMKHPSKELEESNMLKKIEGFENFQTLFDKRVRMGENTYNTDSQHTYNMNQTTIESHLDKKDLAMIDAFFNIQNDEDRKEAESLFVSFYKKIKSFFIR